VLEYFWTLLEGVPTTLGVTLLAFVIGAILGLPLTWAARSRFMPLRFATRFLIDLIRAVPPIVWLFLLFYGVAQQLYTLTAYPAAVIGLGIVSSAYMSEVYRGGLLAVSKGQWQAGEALGLSRVQVLARIIGPQAFKVVLPGAAAWAIALLKETAAVSIIGVEDITLRALSENQRTLDGLGVFGMAALIYIALSIPFAIVSRQADARIRRRVVSQ
jgi:His/Glu/Gln/Arg/opine family amino acid ABC transporter permease subunit